MTDAHAKHDADTRLDEDLKYNLGIGQLKGAFARSGELAHADGENMVEGDIGNDRGPQGHVNPGRVGRTDK